MNICELLQGKVSIPQVKDQLPLIQKAGSADFWLKNDLLEIEHVRNGLRDLIQFLTGGSGYSPIYVKLDDPVIEQKEGTQLPPGYNFEDYKKKVNRYINEHGEALPIYKLTHNIPLTQTDYKELERVMTEELGSKEDYQKAFGDTPLGLMVRRIAKMDHQAAMNEFSDFINDQSLNQRQIAYVQKIINYIERNGYMENTDLMKPPFDKPVMFIKLFDPKKRAAIVQKINEVKDNAVRVQAG